MGEFVVGGAVGGAGCDAGGDERGQRSRSRGAEAADRGGIIRPPASNKNGGGDGIREGQGTPTLLQTPVIWRPVLTRALQGAEL